MELLRTVGRYEIVRRVGRGGMASVFLARQKDLDRMVALKELYAINASDGDLARRFMSESRLAGSLTHPNIVTVFEYFHADGLPYIAMEYVERGSLRPFIGHMTLAQIGGVLEGVLAGLDYAGRREIVHRDVKPENVMVSSEGTVKIADFGIAKLANIVDTGILHTGTRTIAGTPTYMAPEQAMAAAIGPSTDLYSLGLMAYEMVVGQVPFAETDSPVALLLRHVNESIPAASVANPDVDRRISDWIGRLTATAPEDRVQSAGAAWEELEEVLIDILGTRWRREARLTDQHPETSTPATEASPIESSDDYVTYGALSLPGPDDERFKTPRSLTSAPSRVDERSDGVAYSDRGDASADRPPDHVPQAPPRPPPGSPAGSQAREDRRLRPPAHTFVAPSSPPVGSLPPAVQFSIGVNSDFEYLHGPLVRDEGGVEFLGEDRTVRALKERLVHSRGGSFLITGFRGVGKTTVVLRALEELRSESADSLA